MVAGNVTHSWPLVATMREPGRLLDNGELILFHGCGFVETGVTVRK